MNNRQVAHAWAGQQKQSARGSNFFFNGPSIYSYGPHFEIARIMPERIENKTIYQGGSIQVILFTTRDYSSTTAKHKSYVRNAINGRKVFYVPRVDIGDYAGGNATAHELNLKHFLARAKKAHEKARKALSLRKLYVREEQSLVQSAAAYLDLFRPAFKTEEARAVVKELRALIRKERAGKLWTAAELVVFYARELRAKEMGKKRDEKRRDIESARAAQWALDNAARIEDARATLDAWTRGETDALPSYSYEAHLPTRIRIKDKRIETSRGAQVTIRTAVELWRLCTAGTGDAAPVIGFDVDGFKVSAWDGETLTIGCHKLKREELARLAAVLGV